MFQIYPVQLLKANDANILLHQIGVEEVAVGILLPKMENTNIFIKGVKSSWANILKQEMIASGGDVAVNKKSYSCSVLYTDVLLMGTNNVYNYFVKRLKRQPECFKEICDAIQNIINCSDYTISIGKKTYDLSSDFVVIGILNITEDSFSDGGKYLNYDEAMKRVEKMVSSGVDIIDIGGESTRPGSSRISIDKEIERVLPVIDGIIKNFDISVSIDSYKPDLIKLAVKAGAVLVNDVNNGYAVTQILDFMVQYNASALIMMNSSPAGVFGFTPDVDMNTKPIECFLDFIKKTEEQMKKAGISKNKIVYDPGIGFGLSIKDTSKLLKNIYSITSQKIPVCLGLSRKSYIGKFTGLNIADRDSVCNSFSSFMISQGVRIFRTHDPENLLDFLNFYKKFLEV